MFQLASLVVDLFTRGDSEVKTKLNEINNKLTDVKKTSDQGLIDFKGVKEQLGQVTTGIQGLATQLLGLGGFNLGSILGLGSIAGIVGGLGLAAKKFVDMDKAAFDLKAQMANFGGNVDANVDKVNKLAQAISDTTVLSKGQAKSLAVTGLQRGIDPGQIDAVVKGAVGLSESLGKGVEYAEQIVVKYAEFGDQGLRQIPEFKRLLQGRKDHLAVENLLNEKIKQGLKIAQDRKNNTIEGQIDTFQKKIADLWVTISKVLGPPLIKVFTILADAIGVVVDWLGQLISKVNFLDIWNSVVGKIGQKFGWLGDIIMSTWETIKTEGGIVIDAVINGWKQFSDFVGELWDMVVGLFVKMGEKIIELIGEDLWKDIQEKWTTFVDWVKESWAKLTAIISNWGLLVKLTFYSVLYWISRVPDGVIWIKDSFVTLFTWMWDTLPQIANNIVVLLIEPFKALGEFLADFGSSVWDFLSNPSEGFKFDFSSIQGRVDALREKVQSQLKQGGPLELPEIKENDTSLALKGKVNELKDELAKKLAQDRKTQDEIRNPKTPPDPNANIKKPPPLKAGHIERGRAAEKGSFESLESTFKRLQSRATEVTDIPKQQLGVMQKMHGELVKINQNFQGAQSAAGAGRAPVQVIPRAN